ncbi:fibrous sheath CABYR-binding protein-like isoform X2 [Antennarius striatus]|uniref:fibrous sheath CABYR-binding protein-like isoform X2 n=1 Tax=Antennarius striatus TaxID=241820 RepID=UPI0035AE1F41
MPSNFKKNKRRCKKAQAQKRALEELAAKSPVKATPCISVTVPPKAAQKKVTKTPLPAQEKVQQPTPTAAPIAETPPIEVKAVVKEPVAEPIPVKIEAPGPKALVLEKSSVELQDVKEVPALFAEKTLPEPASVAEAETAKEAEPNIPETKPETEVKPPADVSMETSAATEIHTTKTTIVTTETEQTSNGCKPETEAASDALMDGDAAAEAGVEMLDTETAEKQKVEAQKSKQSDEDAVTETTEVPLVEAQMCEQDSHETEPAANEVVTESVGESVEESITEATEDPVVEARLNEQDSNEAEPAADKGATEHTVETDVTEVHEPEQVNEVFSPVASEEDTEAEPLAEEAPDIPAAPFTTEEAVVQSIESPEVPFTIPVAPAEEPENHVTEDKERPANKDIADSLVDDFVVTESASAVEVAISECAAIKPEIVEVSNVLGSQSDSTALLPTENAPAAAPAEEMVIVTPEQKCAEEPKPEICDMPCQTQQAVESVEMLAETSVNGHVVQVSIES